MAGGYVPPHARRGKNASSSASTTIASTTIDAFERELRAASKRISRAETAEEGLALYARTLENLRAFVASSSQDERGDEARVSLANAALEYAGEIMRVERRKALSTTTRADEARTKERAISCAQDALRALEGLSGSPLEKANGVATALSRIVELGGGGNNAAEVSATLARAVEMYDYCATSIENSQAHEDVMPALWNCADARLKVAEHRAETGDVDGASTSYRESFSLYERACGFCDANRGDDLSGLLYDWGCSLTSYASFLAQSLDASEDAVRIADAAVEKLRAAGQFAIGDVGALNALGDAYQTKAEILSRFDDAAPAVDNLRLAICEAYDVALKLNSTELNSTIGRGEAHMALAALFRRSGDHARADEASDTAWKAYDKALKLGDKNDPGTCEERFEVVYNAACAANRAGQRDAARHLLSQLLLCDGTTQEAIDNDPDLK